MTLQLQTGADNNTLRTPSKPVQTVTGELRSFALDMIKSMQAENGVGLAAPQVGRNIRLIVCKLNPEDKNELILPMVNPEILQLSQQTEEGEEGCLSLPGLWGKVTRPKTALVRFQNLKGQEQTLELTDFNARIIQHEVDHLNGILFIDKAVDVKKSTKDEDAPHI